MAEQIGNHIPAPGYAKGAYVNDDELLMSTVGYTQKGVTLKPNQGVLPLGTVLARETASKKYVKFVSGGSGGAEVAVGILRQTVDTDSATQTYLQNIVIKGILNRQKVSSANGGISAIVTAFPGSRDSAVLNTFTF